MISEQDMLGDRLSARRRAAQAGRAFPDRGRGADARRSGRPCRSRHRPLSRARDHRSRWAAPARLLASGICRRRQALSAGREHRRAVALRHRRRRRARPAGRRRLAGEQGAGSRSASATSPDELIKIAAERGAAARRRSLTPPEHRVYDEFAARFPYEETDDQLTRDRRRARRIWPRAGRWTGWSAATSASARPRWRCARPSSRRWRASRWR